MTEAGFSKTHAPTLMSKLRVWLVRRLAGDMVVVKNIGIDATPIMLDGEVIGTVVYLTHQDDPRVRLAGFPIAFQQQPSPLGNPANPTLN